VYRSREGVPDLRTAAHALAIEKFGWYYVDVGLQAASALQSAVRGFAADD
jgi:hypothetical protein